MAEMGFGFFLEGQILEFWNERDLGPIWNHFTLQLKGSYFRWGFTLLYFDFVFLCFQMRGLVGRS
jgi:hypothetical protein